MTENISSTEPSSSDRLDDLESMLDSEEHFPDVVLLVGAGKRPILAHRCILSLRSPVFKATFQRHESLGEVEIADTGYEAMMELLRYLYAGRVRDVRSLRGELSRAAEKYGVGELKAICDAAGGESETTCVARALECRDCRESLGDARAERAASDAESTMERLARFLAMRERPRRARHEGARRRHQKTPCPSCRKMFAYRKSLNDHIIFEHIVPCEADGAPKGMAVELLRLVNDSAAGGDRAKIEELAIAIGAHRVQGARV